MRTFILAACAALALGSCSKKDHGNTSSVDGRWQVVSITEQTTSRTLLPPAGPNQSLLIFKEGKFYGQTPVNSIGNGEFSLSGTDGIRFNGYTSTEVSEGDFGMAIFEVLNSCLIQSLAPCTPALITWDTPDHMHINGRYRFILNLERE